MLIVKIQDLSQFTLTNHKTNSTTSLLPLTSNPLAKPLYKAQPRLRCLESLSTLVLLRRYQVQLDPIKFQGRFKPD